MARVRPLLLAALAFAIISSCFSVGPLGRTRMASSVPVSASALSDILAGPDRVTRFVCGHCTATGKLSSRGLFLNRAAVRRHIAASKPCRAAEAVVRMIQVETRAGDVMAGAGGAAGPAPDVRHQPAGDVFRIQHT